MSCDTEPLRAWATYLVSGWSLPLIARYAVFMAALAVLIGDFVARRPS